VIFITYGIYLEKKIIGNQIEYILEKIFGQVKLLNPNAKLFNNNDLENMKSIDSEEIKKEIDIFNKKLLLKGALFNGILLLVAFIIILFMGIKYEQKLDNGERLSFGNYLGKLMQYNLLTLIFIGLTYTVFATYISYNYIYINEKQIGLKIVEKIEM
jgi:magnesium-transporting ATPase (P-type)